MAEAETGQGHSEDALRILDNDWQDAREASIAYFRDAFLEDDWAPSLLVGICDIVPDLARRKSL